MKDLYLMGAGGHCVSCLDVIESEGKFKVLGIFDIQEKVGMKILGVPVIGTDADLQKFVKPGVFFLITVGQIKTPKIRMSIYKNLIELGADLATVISPRAYVSKHATIDAGTIVMHDCLVNANAHIAGNCILNTKSLIEHDAKIEAHCHISTGAVVNGGCHIGEGSFVGSNSVIKEAFKIPPFSVLSAGVFHK